MSVQVEETVESIFREIQNGVGFHKNLEGHIGRKLAQLLREDDWKPYSDHSKCKVASYETKLQKGSAQIQIIESNFFGAFTDISFRPRPYLP